MDKSIVLGLLQNTSILLSFSLIYDYLWSRNENPKLLYQKVLAGLIIGCFGIFLIMTPWKMVPGTVFDVRSVLLSISGLFLGLIPTIIAMAITLAYRIWIGGGGVWMGMAVILTSGTIGLLWKFLRPGWRSKNTAIELLAMGLVVHLIMLACTGFLPPENAANTLKTIFLPVLTIYPLATLFLGLLMINWAKNWQHKKELKISEQRYRNFISHSSEGIFRVDLVPPVSILLPKAEFIEAINRQARVAEVNDAMAKMYGLTPGEQLGRLVTDFTPDYGERAVLILKNENYQVANIETYELDKNGKEIILNVSFHGEIVKDNLLTIWGVQSDITDRKKAEKALQESETRYKSFISQVSEGVYRFELDKPMPLDLPIEEQIDFFYDHARIAECNPAFMKMYGIKDNRDIIGKSLLDFHGSSYHPQYRQVIRQLMANDFRLENAIIQEKDAFGNLKSFSNNALGIIEKNHLIRAWGTQTDITETKKAEEAEKILKEALQESEAKYKTAFTTSPDSININKMDGTYVDINDGFIRMTGYAREDVIAIKSTDLNIWAMPEDRQKMLDGLKQNRMINNLESVFRAKDGSLITGLMSVQIININNEPHILSITRDISQRKEMENELVLAKEKAEESDRLKSAFLNNLSHEIRTPLNGIVGFADFLAEPGATEADRDYYARIINRNCTQLVSIIDDIINISTIEAGQETVRSSKTDVRLMMSDLAEQFGKNISEQIMLKYEVNLGSNTSKIITDATKLQQILTNLIGNAVKYTEKGTVRILCEIKDSMLQFTISDTGIGILPEYHHQIFERFHQVRTDNKKLYGGTGLGLAISKAYVELLGGKIWLASTPAKGSEFYFTIPYKPAINQTIIEMETAVNPQQISSAKAKTILLVEDDWSNFLLAERILKIAGFTVIHAKNGLEAIDELSKNPNIDLVLMDLKMPGMSGYEATKLIKSQRPLLPVIALTAYALAGDREKALEAGCDDYVSKPIKSQALMEKIGKYLGG